MQVEEEGQGVLERTVLAYIERVFARHECEGAAACLLGVDIQRFADNQHKCRIEVQLRGDLVSHIARGVFSAGADTREPASSTYRQTQAPAAAAEINHYSSSSNASNFL